MIGGDDLLIPVQPGVVPMDACAQAICAHWPSAVFEDAATGKIEDSYQALAVEKPSEVFVYRDSETAHDWDVKGAAPELKNSMIHLLVSSEGVTVVADDLNEPPLSKIVGAIKDTISRSRETPVSD